MTINKKIIVLLVICMLMTAFHAGAVEAYNETPPDLVVSKVWLSNPNYEVGDVVTIYADITNIGGTAMDLGYFAVQGYDTADGYVGIEPLGLKNNWTRPVIFPGQSIAVALNDVKITAEDIAFRVVCNSANIADEVNKSNNVTKVQFSSVRDERDLVINDIRISDAQLDEGTVVTFEVDYQNLGLSQIDYSSIEVELTVDSKKYYLREMTNVESKEKRTLKSEAIYVKGSSISVNAYINPNGGVAEDNYDNNEFTEEFTALSYRGKDYTWEAMRIGGGGYVRGAFISDAVKDELYFWPDVNGLYRYDPYSKTNIHLSNAFPTAREDYGYENIKYAAGMELDPSDPKTIFYAGGAATDGSEGAMGPSFLLRSFDGGNTWTEIPKNFEYVENALTNCNAVLELDPNNSNVLYSCSAKRGLWRNTNALGRAPKWEQLTLPGYEYKADYSTPVVGVVVDGTKVSDGISQIIYAAVKGMGVFVSHNGGDSFELMDGSPSAGLFNIWLDADKNLLVSGTCGVWKWADNQWIDITPYPNKTYYSAVNPNNPEMIAAATGNFIYLTKDGGETWNEILSGTSAINKIPWQPDTYFRNNIGFVRFDAFNNNRLIFGAWFGAAQTMDCTAEDIVWEDITWGIEEVFIRALIALPEGSDAHLVIGSNDINGLKVDTPSDFPSVQINEPWTQETVGLSFCEKHPDFIARNGGTARGSGAGNGAYSTDGGNTWIEFPDYPLKADGATRAQNGKIAVACDYNDNGVPTILINTLFDDGKVYRTDDLGETWTLVDSLPQGAVKRFLHTNEPLAADKVNKDVFYFYDSDNGEFLTSTNGGVSFSKKSALPKGDFYSLVVPVAGQEGCVFVSINHAGLYYTDDYGQSFTKVEGVNRSKLFDLGAPAPCNPDVMTMYVYGEVRGNEGVFRSTDFGESWVQINAPDKHTLWNDTKVMKADRRTFGVIYTGSNGSGIVMGYPSKLDITKPRTGIYTKIDGKTVNTASVEIAGGSTKPGTVYLNVNGTETHMVLDSQNRFTCSVVLNEGENHIEVYSLDMSGNKSNIDTASVVYNPDYVGLSVANSSAVTVASVYKISGAVEIEPKSADVYINGQEIKLNRATGIFEAEVPLSYGLNNFSVTAVTDSGSEESVEVTVDRDIIPPTLSFDNVPSVTSDPLFIVNTKLSEPGTVSASGNVYHAYTASQTELNIPFVLKDGENELTFEISDLAGNTNTQTINIAFIADDKYKQVENDEVIAYGETPVIDGSIEDNWVLNRVIAKKADATPNIYGKYGMLADEDYLYIAVEINDRAVYGGNEEYAESYTVDSVEIYFDPDLSRGDSYDKEDQQIRLGIGSKAYGASKRAKYDDILTASSMGENGYIIEAAIPWNLIFIDYEIGKAFGFEISVNDSSNGISRDGVMCWNGDGNTYRDTSKFGTAYIGQK